VGWDSRRGGRGRDRKGGEGKDRRERIGEKV